MSAEVKAELEPSMQKYDTMCKKAVTSLQTMLEWAEEDMMVCEVELEQCEDDKEVMKTALSRQYAFKKGLCEHLKGLLQTSEQEEHWALQSLVQARGGLQPDLNAPPWMAPVQAPQLPPPQQQLAPYQQLAPQHQQRPSEYPRMSWMPIG